MKIHFIGDLSGNIERYKQIVEFIEKLNHTIVTKHFIERSLSALEKETDDEATDYSIKMKKWINKADVIIVEITKPGLGSGYEISTAMALGKPVIALYEENEKNTPHVLRGIKSDKLLVASYNPSNLLSIIEEGIDYASSQQDTRFNFFVSPKHISFLDWVSHNKKIPRSVFLRRLIEKEMANDSQYTSEQN